MESEKTHLTAEEIEQYRQRTLTATGRQRFDRHVASCHGCLEQALATKHSGLAFTQLIEAFTTAEDKPFHLSSDDLKRYASRESDEADKTIFESHLENCQECRDAHATVVNTVARERAATTPVRGQSSLWQRFIRPWDWNAIFIPGRLAGAAALAASVLVACVLGLWMARHYERGTDLTKQARQTSTQKISSVPRVRLKDGPGEITIDEKGNLGGLDWLTARNQEAVKEALTTAQLSRPRILQDLSSPPTKLMGEPSTQSPFALFSPVGTVIDEDRPVLRWQALSGATAYLVSVFDSEFQRIVKSTPLSSTEWRLPIPLRHGSSYFWQVTALRDNQQITAPVAPAPRAQFRVLDQQTMEALGKARAHQPNSHLALGVLYAHAGLLSDSEREFQALVKENPDSPLASTLLRSVRGWEHKSSSTK